MFQVASDLKAIVGYIAGLLPVVEGICCVLSRIFCEFKMKKKTPPPGLPSPWSFTVLHLTPRIANNIW